MQEHHHGMRQQDVRVASVPYGFVSAQEYPRVPSRSTVGQADRRVRPSHQPAIAGGLVDAPVTATSGS